MLRSSSTRAIVGMWSYGSVVNTNAAVTLELAQNVAPLYPVQLSILLGK
jgi:hypothetical protein